MIGSVFSLPYKLDSPYLVYILIIMAIYQPDMCHLTFNPFHDLLTLLNLCQVLVIRSVSPLSYNLNQPYLLHILIIMAIYSAIYVSSDLQLNACSVDLVKFMLCFCDQISFSIFGPPQLNLSLITQGPLVSVWDLKSSWLLYHLKF